MAEHADTSIPFTRSLLDTLIFVINFTLSTLFFIACVISIGVADNPYAAIGGVLFVLPIGIYAVAEWVCWYRKHDQLYRPLGKINLVFAAFVGFALVTNVAEALSGDGPIDIWFIAVFGICFAVFAGYLTWCGWRRIQVKPAIPEAIQNSGEPI